MKIYTDLEAVKRNPTMPTATLLYPFLGVFPEAFHDPRAPMSRRFDAFFQNGKESISLVAQEQSDFFVFPFEWYGLHGWSGREEMLDAFFAEAASFGKLGVVFAYGDEHVDLSRFANAIVLQSNLCASEMTPQDRAIPAFVEDLRIGREVLVGRRWSLASKLGLRRRPSISFCGTASSAPIRELAIRTLQNSSRVRTRFVLRSRYFGGAWEKELGGFNFHTLQRIRKEYVQNLCCADYVLCVRGWGNYSARFYEALCAGKMPVLIDTDCAFPFSRIIDYEQLMLRIPASQVDHADEFIADFDATLSDEEFMRRQMLCRDTWIRYLSPSGFLTQCDRAVFDP